MNPFDPSTENAPIAAADRRMVESTFENCDLTGSRFHRVHLKESVFDGVNLSTCTFRDVTIGGSTITLSCMTDAKLDGNVTGMTINGVPLADLFEAYEKQTGRRVE